jgi:hypothetical protein
MCAALVTAVATPCRKGYSTCMHKCAHLGLLYGQAASTQQPPSGRHPVPELAKRGSTKGCSSTTSGKAREGPRETRRSQQPTGTMHSLPSCALHSSPAPWQLWQQEGATCPQDLVPHPLLQGLKPKKFLLKN